MRRNFSQRAMSARRACKEASAVGHAGPAARAVPQPPPGNEPKVSFQPPGFGVYRQVREIVWKLRRQGRVSEEDDSNGRLPETAAGVGPLAKH
jgi:hypothetical protein